MSVMMFMIIIDNLVVGKYCRKLIIFICYVKFVYFIF